MYYYFLDEYPEWYDGKKLDLESGESILLCSDIKHEGYHGYGYTCGRKIVGNKTDYFSYRDKDETCTVNFITYKDEYRNMKLPCLNTDLVQKATKEEHQYPFPPYNNIFLSHMVLDKVIVTKIAEHVIHYIPFKEPKPAIAKPE